MLLSFCVYGDDTGELSSFISWTLAAGVCVADGLSAGLRYKSFPDLIAPSPNSSQDCGGFGYTIYYYFLHKQSKPGLI